MTSQPALWEYMIGQPSNRLKGLVCSYSGYSENAGRPVRRLEVVKDRVTVVIGFSASLQIRSATAGAASATYQIFSVGLGSFPLLIKHGGSQRCIEIELFPWAATQLFGRAAMELSQSMVDLVNLWGMPVLLLAEQLSESPTWLSRFTLVDQFLAARFESSSCVTRLEIQWAWQQLETSGGCIPIRYLAKTLGWSDRHLAKCFREGTGLTPKLAARHIRFSRAHQLLMAPGRYELSEIAFSTGYSDQSHFSREFYHFSSCTPRDYRQARFLDLPGTPAEAVRDI